LGGFDGLAADFTRLLAKKAGLIIAYEQGGSFADVVFAPLASKRSPKECGNPRQVVASSTR
jgi:hypothetical protein